MLILLSHSHQLHRQSSQCLFVQRGPFGSEQSHRHQQTPLIHPVLLVLPKVQYKILFLSVCLSVRPSIRLCLSLKSSNYIVDGGIVSCTSKHPLRLSIGSKYNLASVCLLLSYIDTDSLDLFDCRNILSSRFLYFHLACC